MADTMAENMLKTNNDINTDAEIWQRVRAGEMSARERLVEANMQLVFWLARRFMGRGFEWDDLCQIGTIGLLKAIDNFQPEYKNRFSTYAVPMILGELRRAVRDDSLLHVSCSYKEKIARILQAAQEFISLQGREPTMAELADILQLPQEQIVLALEANQRPLSLQTPIATADGRDDKETSLLETVPALDNEDKWVQNLALQEAFARLPARLRYVMEARYYKEQTQQQIATALGVSQVQVSRLEKQALRLLREYL